MITLYQFPSFWGLPNVSPFCMKLETYLRMAQIPHDIRTTTNLRRAPKGKLPYITDGDVILADTSCIIDYLVSTYGNSLDTHLTPLQYAEGIALQRLIEDHLYWVMVYSRWVDKPGLTAIKESFFQKMPTWARWLIPKIATHKVQKQLFQAGMGRHAREEIYEFGRQDLLALATILADKAFILGDKPSRFDAILYGFLANILWVPYSNPLQEFIKQQQNLVEFCERMQKAYF